MKKFTKIEFPTYEIYKLLEVLDKWVLVATTPNPDVASGLARELNKCGFKTLVVG